MHYGQAGLTIKYILVIFLIAACQTPINEGTVIDKDFIPAHTYITQEPKYDYVCGMEHNFDGDLEYRCNYRWVGTIPVIHNAPDTWVVTLRNCEADCRNQVREISESDFNIIHIGQWYKMEDE